MKILAFKSPSAITDKDMLQAMDASQAVIQFDTQGNILWANDNFLRAMGYRLEELVGRHHSIFMPANESSGLEYRSFWERLRQGYAEAAEFCRIDKQGHEVWIQGSYNPIFDRSGNVKTVVKFATVITEQKLKNAYYAGQIEALSRSQAIIEFDLQGNIITANDNFCRTFGYSLPEIQGKHHRMFVRPEDASGIQYQAFWEDLGAGQYKAGEFCRIDKNGRDIWIQASYNPILDASGRPYRVIKFATDTTATVIKRMNNEATLDQVTNDLEAIVDAISTANQVAENGKAASARTAMNVQSVAAATEEMTASIKEISGNMVKTAKSAEVAVEQAKDASESTERLSATAKSMFGIIDLIQVIADQINLLALNATIEASRAGEAGRGFAVVATEVKTLANRAMEAVKRIKSEVMGLQGISDDVVSSLEKISDEILQVWDLAKQSASEIEQQSKVAADMALRMNEAAGDVDMVALSISEMATAAGVATQKAIGVKAELNEMYG